MTERLARMEAALAKLQDAVAASASRLTSLQAQIDHLVAKIRPV